MLCSAQRAEPKIATASASVDPSLRGKASTSYFYSFLQFVRSFVQSFSLSASQSPVFITLVVLSPVRSSVCTGFGGPRGLVVRSLPLSSETARAISPTGRDSDSRNFALSSCGSQSEVSQVSTYSTITNDGGRTRSDRCFLQSFFISCRERCLTQITSGRA